MGHDGWWLAGCSTGIRPLSCSAGVLTDSPNALSYSRHDYFRRILCNIFGQELDSGLLPWMEQQVQDSCYDNVKGYINFTQNQL